MYNIPRTDPAYSYYDDGYDTGKNWKDDYRPGGPYRCTDRRRYPDMYDRDLANSADWFRGYDAGLEANKMWNKLKTA